MKQKLVIGSVFVAAVIILTSMASVIGKVAEENVYDVVDSPLFPVRSQQVNTIMSTQYLGYGKSNDWINIKSTEYNQLISKALDILNTKPGIRDSVINYIESNPTILSLVREHGLSLPQIKQDMNVQLQNPEDLQAYLAQYLEYIPEITPPEPLGLSTSSAIGCFIIVIALLPLLLILTVLIATITIVTCLNVGGCFEAIWTHIGEAFIQGLSPNF